MPFLGQAEPVASHPMTLSHQDPLLQKAEWQRAHRGAEKEGPLWLTPE